MPRTTNARRMIRSVHPLLLIKPIVGRSVYPCSSYCCDVLCASHVYLRYLDTSMYRDGCTVKGVRRDKVGASEERVRERERV